jgi:hypothetical protein
LATAIESLGAGTPAMGARSIGKRKPNRFAKERARSNAGFMRRTSISKAWSIEKAV